MSHVMNFPEVNHLWLRGLAAPTDNPSTALIVIPECLQLVIMRVEPCVCVFVCDRQNEGARERVHNEHKWSLMLIYTYYLHQGACLHPISVWCVCMQDYEKKQTHLQKLIPLERIQMKIIHYILPDKLYKSYNYNCIWSFNFFPIMWSPKKNGLEINMNVMLY